MAKTSTLSICAHAKQTTTQNFVDLVEFLKRFKHDPRG
jgi:hypothetical protein